jgi:hypothetical protein
LQADVVSALDYFGFQRVGDTYLKFCLPVQGQGEKIALEIAYLASRLQLQGLDDWLRRLGDSQSLSDPQWAASQEHRIWPAKFADANIPCYIVPIRPEYAVHLFDEVMAKGTLYGRDLRLALHVKGVFYTGATGSPKVPSRIMWYVSKGGGGDTGMKLRACSRLVGAESGTPKELFKRHRHLGVYGWQQVYDTAHQNLDRSITALCFDDTELMKNPIHWNRFQPVLKRAGIQTFLRRPTPVPPSVFLELYELGTR